MAPQSGDTGTVAPVRYEYRTITIPRSVDRSTAHRYLTDEAEYGRWELDRSVLYTGGHRKVRLKRRIIRVRRTL